MTMSALQQILAGKSKQPSSPSSSDAAAPPVAKSAVAEPSTSAPPSAVPQPAAAPPSSATGPSPGPNAAAVATPQGGPPDTLAAVLGAFVANAGKMPQVNPPQAAAVLAGPTALEVAGHPEPEEVKEAPPAPVEKPADVLAAEQAKKARRTAPVVQAELDAALKRIGELEDSLANAETRLQDAGAGATDDANAAALAEAVEMIQALQAEALVATEDNAKAWARVAAVEAERDEAREALTLPPGVGEACKAIAEAQPMTLNQAIRLVQFVMPAGCSVTIEAQS